MWVMLPGAEPLLPLLQADPFEHMVAGVYLYQEQVCGGPNPGRCTLEHNPPNRDWVRHVEEFSHLGRLGMSIARLFLTARECSMVRAVVHELALLAAAPRSHFHFTDAIPHPLTITTRARLQPSRDPPRSFARR